MAIIALHNGKLLGMQFIKFFNDLPNNTRNISEIQVAFKDLGSFNVNTTISDKNEVKDILDLGSYNN